MITGGCADIQMAGVNLPMLTKFNDLHTKIGERNLSEKLWSPLWCCWQRNWGIHLLSNKSMPMIQEKYDVLVWKSPLFSLGTHRSFRNPVISAGFEKVQKTCSYLSMHWCEYSQSFCCSDKLWMEKELKLKWKQNPTRAIFKAQFCCHGFFPKNFCPSVRKTVCPGHISIP